MKEHALQNAIRNALAGHCLLFRANVGQAWTGDSFHKLPNGDLVIKNPRPFTTGLPAGFSDTFGLVAVDITQDMVGARFGRFIAGEIKTDTGRVSPKQTAFLRAVNDNGGAAGVWRSPADALAMVASAKGKR
ncbi:flap endonuclease [Achromobacter phage Mano]|uniref:Flap endonuclease n=1 Tax=Achromobacter phage Mano TaxID=2767570 RepID=A0A7L8G6D2_9CAUD|nr:endonuclease [Achromobacter phage Mano]QOE32776.1 flap endonuclease [Achromobacter phage Mano]